MSEELEHWLARFHAAADPGPYGVPWTHHHAGRKHGHHVVISAMIHGDEVGTLPAVVRLVEAARAGTWDPGGPLTMILGNVEAGRLNRRFIDFDLNRAWVFSIERHGHEPARARELRPILDRADLLLDLHQTILDTENPFWIFPWHPDIGRWARALGTSPVGLTRPPGLAFAAGDLKCIDEYVRDDGRLGFTVELGRKGFDPIQANNAERTIRTLVATVDRIQAGETTLDAEARRGGPIRWYRTVHQEDWGDPSRRLRPGLHNWSPVQGGVDLAAAGSPPIVPAHDGVVLFPKYPVPGEPLPTQIYHLAVPLEGPPELVYSET
jgi:succinylglutamate desuccinylase